MAASTLNNILIESDHRTALPISDKEIYEWAEDYISLPSIGYSEPGAFSTKNHHYLDEPFKAIKNYETKVITVCFPVKVGKTMLFDISLCYFILNRPGPIQWIFESADQARDHMKSKVFPLMMGCDPLKELLPSDLRKMRQDGIHFPHMPLFIGSPSDSFLNNRDSMIVVADEAWKYKQGKLAMAHARNTAFARQGIGKFIILSQAGDIGSELHDYYSKGTQECYSVPCPHCKTYFIPVWKDLKYNTVKDAQGHYLINQILPTIYYPCPSCKKPIKDSPSLKGLWCNDGKYEVTNPNHFQGYRSFNMTSLIVDDWDDLVELWLNINTIEEIGEYSEKIKTFKLARLAEFCYAKGKGDTTDEVIIADDYDPNSEWKEALLRLMSIDVQYHQGVYWVMIAEFDQYGNGRMLWYGQQVTETDLSELQKKYNVPSNCVFIDSNAPTTIIHPMLARNDWIGLKGDQKEAFLLKDKSGKTIETLYSSFKKPIVQMQSGEKKVVKWAFFANQPICGIVKKYSSKKTKLDWKALHNIEYKNQMKKVYRKPIMKGNTKVWVFEDDGSAHAFDCMKMLVTGLLLHRKKVDFMTNLGAITITTSKRDNLDKAVSDTIDKDEAEEME